MKTAFHLVVMMFVLMPLSLALGQTNKKNFSFGFEGLYIPISNFPGTTSYEVFFSSKRDVSTINYQFKINPINSFVNGFGYKLFLRRGNLFLSYSEYRVSDEVRGVIRQDKNYSFKYLNTIGGSNISPVRNDREPLGLSPLWHASGGTVYTNYLDVIRRNEKLLFFGGGIRFIRTGISRGFRQHVFVDETQSVPKPFTFENFITIDADFNTRFLLVGGIIGIKESLNLDSHSILRWDNSLYIGVGKVKYVTEFIDIDDTETIDYRNGKSFPLKYDGSISSGNNSWTVTPIVETGLTLETKQNNFTFGIGTGLQVIFANVNYDLNHPWAWRVVAAVPAGLFPENKFFPILIPKLLTLTLRYDF